MVLLPIARKVSLRAPRHNDRKRRGRFCIHETRGDTILLVYVRNDDGKSRAGFVSLGEGGIFTIHLSNYRTKAHQYSVLSKRLLILDIDSCGPLSPARPWWKLILMILIHAAAKQHTWSNATFCILGLLGQLPRPGTVEGVALS